MTSSIAVAQARMQVERAGRRAVVADHLAPASSSVSISQAGMKPLAPVTSTRRPCQKCGSGMEIQSCKEHVRRQAE